MTEPETPVWFSDPVEAMRFLIEERKRQGLSQRVLAGRLGVSQSQLAAWETRAVGNERAGTWLPRTKTVIRWAEGLGFRVNVTFTLERRGD